ncbi:MAG: hypothetical protein COT81_04785 [Candidatus Buchananbacteria bacterium CG10_big_fil_rev_8_21_14_0_10_42_9]|uniref:Type II secretion system protein GspF domain-containing protein n=1 Tax=Candidatus Buchananbacteria bacterium CG10_big_fil_rev_8_21_14_0_10_42_9 TaxID=1974526 RepID=A0A2H0W097_9BACT|nr:MAG: hypothetical protein COT81_04785 [Candidatus Buchananbacteria bacterium CG10_big_fil_rev_8_21_14_0_10_42_9]
MPNFYFEASDTQGIVHKGEHQAPSKDVVAQYLRDRKLIPLVIKSTEKKNRLSFLQIGIGSKVSRVQIIFLIRDLSISLKSGLSILETLDILASDTKNPTLKKILVDAKNNLSKGQDLSDTLEQYSKYFPQIYIGMIRAGEASGNLGETLSDAAVHLKKDYELTKRIKAAMVYPMILVIASVAVIGLLLIFVLPNLIETFERGNIELPAVTKVLIKVSALLSYSYAADFVVFIIFLYLITYFRKTKIGQTIYAKLSNVMPMVKELMRKIAIVKFTRAMGYLLTSGMGITKSLEFAADSVGRDEYKKIVHQSLESIKKGNALSDTLDQYPSQFPKLLTGIIRVGETTGSLENVFKLSSEFYEEEVDSSLKTLLSYLEPVLLLIMGLVVGGVAFAVLIPIYQLVSGFS